MQTEKNTENSTRISLIGKFHHSYDEEYIARSFEMLGLEVQRISEHLITHQICGLIDGFDPDFVLWTKLSVSEPSKVRDFMKKYKTVCWVFDLYFDYQREYRLKTHPAFTADYVFTTDNGHQKQFEALGINHRCVRQGIWHEQCYLEPINARDEIVFVGSENLHNKDRQRQLEFIQRNYPVEFRWYGRFNTHDVREERLNQLYSSAKIVIGDSVYSPFYWSNRVVETLGRGGFLIHQEVEGIKEEYPFLITYKRGDFNNLKDIINHYFLNEQERQSIIKKNLEWVKNNYTSEKKCQEILNFIL